MNKTEHKIFRGLIEKNLSDQELFTDSDDEETKHNETILKTEMSNYQNYTINTTTPYSSKNNSDYIYIDIYPKSSWPLKINFNIQKTNIRANNGKVCPT